MTLEQQKQPLVRRVQHVERVASVSKSFGQRFSTSRPSASRHTKVYRQFMVTMAQMPKLLNVDSSSDSARRMVTNSPEASMH